MKQLLNQVEQHVLLSDEEKELFSSYWSRKTVSKGAFILRNGEVCHTDNYVIAGALKAYYIQEKTGKEEVLYFAVNDWWATDIYSFRHRTPSVYNIEALQTTDLLQIRYHSFEALLEKLPKLERFFRIILESYVGALQKRIIYNNSFDAKQRLNQFKKNYPRIFETVPNYLIASYLGISPEFLSRIQNG